MKTEIQRRIELSVTNGRSYQEVPYTRLLGNRLALRQWGLFSNCRCIKGNNSPSDKTSFFEYIPFFVDQRMNGALRNYLSATSLMYTQKSFLERRIEGDPMQALVVQKS